MTAVSCLYPEHHTRGGFDWLLWALLAAVAAFLGFVVYTVTQAIGKGVLTAVAACVGVLVVRGVVRAVVGSVRSTPSRRGGELPRTRAPGVEVSRGAYAVAEVSSVPAPAVDELSVRRARRVA